MCVGGVWVLNVCGREIYKLRIRRYLFIFYIIHDNSGMVYARFVRVYCVLNLKAEVFCVCLYFFDFFFGLLAFSLVAPYELLACIDWNKHQCRNILRKNQEKCICLR